MGQPRPPAASIIAFLALAAALASTWVLPLRLLYGEGNSYYTFAVVGDEPYYADRIQALIPGTTSTNPHNGIADPNAISNLFLDGLLREIVTLLHIDVITFFWIWRFVFPLVMFAACWWLSRAIFGRRRSQAEHCVFAALGYALIHFLYGPIVRTPELQGWIMRVPTGIEYALSLAVLVTFWRLIVLRSTAAAVSFAVAMAVLANLRPYSAYVWGIACGLGLLIAIASGRIKLRPVLLAAAVGIVLLVPLIAVETWNRGIPAYREMVQRYFGDRPYSIHLLWARFLIVGIVIIAGAFLLKGRRRVAVFALGITIAALPVLAGIPPGVRSELLGYDRFSCLYLPVLAFVALFALRRYFRRTNWAFYATTGLALLTSGAVLFRNGSADFNKLQDAPYASIKKEQRYLAGYQYIAKKTSEDAWVLLDDGIDWSVVPPGDMVAENELYHRSWNDDMFSIVARRKRFTHLRMYMCPMTNTELAMLTSFHRSAFGLSGKGDRAFGAMLKAFKPGYIFWKREASVGRGRAGRLREASDVVYTDDACEVWQIRYPDALKIFESTAADATP